MLRTILTVVGIFGVPIIVLVGAGTLMMEISGMNGVLRKHGAEIPRSLAQRRFGYREAEAKEYWAALALKDNGLIAQKRFLQIDLFFALLLAGAIAFSTIWAWMELGRPWTVFVFLIPVFLYLLADWLETSIHLRAVSLLVDAGPQVSIDDGSIRLSGYATIVKWWSAMSAGLVLLGMSIALSVQNSDQANK